MIPYEEIPTNFVSSTLTVHQKEIVQIKYYIKLALDKWDGEREKLYDKLIPELHLGSRSIRRFAENLPKEIDSANLICPCCEEPFKLRPQAYWSYIDSDSNIKLLEPEKFFILCSRNCSKALKEVSKEVKALSERTFYCIENESTTV